MPEKRSYAIGQYWTCDLLTGRIASNCALQIDIDRFVYPVKLDNLYDIVQAERYSTYNLDTYGNEVVIKYIEMSYEYPWASPTMLERSNESNIS